MILNNKYKSVEIDITTYKKEQRFTYITKTMNEDLVQKEYRKSNQNRFICSICLNKKPSHEETRNIECCKRKSKSCPICQKNCETDKNINSTQYGCKKNDDKNKESKLRRTPSEVKAINGKNTYIQTSQPDVTQGLTLLNEVLTVFQSKKQIDLKKDYGSKTLIVKDASVETDTKKTTKLTVSRTFYYSLGENDQQDHNGKFSIINCQPESTKISQFSIDLINRKSSSIPQMKLEELKNSLKEKTKSKDAIEEVNRMFATVRKNDLLESLDDSNRPMIRNGPRVLPVVKTNTHNSVNKKLRQDTQACRCCQTSYQMSSGDSFQRACYHKTERCDNCCTSCCHYQHHRCLTAEKVCEHSCNTSKECK